MPESSSAEDQTNDMTTSLLEASADQGSIPAPDSFVYATDPATLSAIRGEAAAGLLVPNGRQRSLAPWLFYDERGSTLFSALTRLPEYYLTGDEREIFLNNAATIIGFAPQPVTVVELGAGTGEKTGILLREAVRRQGDLLYQPIDVSRFALEEAKAGLEAEIPGVRVMPQEANYITMPYTVERPEGCSVLALYIGSSIGNFLPDQAVTILRLLRKNLKKTGDSLVLGVDLAPSVNKCVSRTVLAYDDPAGVTAAFNCNVLHRLNRELGTDFQIDQWAHRALWNAEESRIEMHLVSLGDQSVNLFGRPIHFKDGETIHTENSYKYTERRMRELLLAAGFASPHWLLDQHHRFGVVMTHAA